MSKLKAIFNQHRLLLIFIFTILVVLSFTDIRITNCNSASRFLTIESLAERGSFTIDEKNNLTNDKVFIDGHYYSSKPPVLSVMGAGVYFILHQLFNLHFPDDIAFTRNSDLSVTHSPSVVIYLVTIILAGFSYLLLLYHFYLSLRFFKIEQKYKSLLILGLAFGTLYLPYATSLNNHVVVGAFLFMSFYHLLKIKIEKLGYKRLRTSVVYSGLFCSLAAVADLPTGMIFLGLFFVYYLFTIKPKKLLIFYILAAVPLLALHFYLNLLIIGDFLPAQLHPEYWEVDPIGLPQLSGQEVKPSIVYYLFHIFIGKRGLLLYTPILAFSFYSIFRIVRRKDHSFNKEAVLVLAGFVLITLFYCLLIRGYAGRTFGFRWFIAVTPLLYFFTIFLFTQKPRFQFFIDFFLVCMVISILFALVGLYNPWSNDYLADEYSIFPLKNNIWAIAEKIGINLWR